VQTLADITREAETGPMVAHIAGTVAARMERKSAKGTAYAFVSLSDPTGLYEVTCFSDLLTACRDRLEPGRNVVLQVKVEPSGEQVKMLANSVALLEEFVADAGAGCLAVEIQGADTIPRLAEVLTRVTTEITAPSRARGPIRLRLRHEDEIIEIEVANDAPLTTPARQALRAVPGVLDVIEE
jgi:DNA polymerase III subunit alpha